MECNIFGDFYGEKYRIMAFKFQFVGIFLLCDCHWQSTYFNSLRGAPPRGQFEPDWPAGVDTPLAPPGSLLLCRFHFIVLLYWRGSAQNLPLGEGGPPRQRWWMRAVSFILSILLDSTAFFPHPSRLSPCHLPPREGFWCGVHRNDKHQFKSIRKRPLRKQRPFNYKNLTIPSGFGQ